MTAQEIAWLDGYHARVAKELAPLIAADTRAWLSQATRPLRA
jgi:Xaa-Pro aminopeptidase